VGEKKKEHAAAERVVTINARAKKKRAWASVGYTFRGGKKGAGPQVRPRRRRRQKKKRDTQGFLGVVLGVGRAVRKKKRTHASQPSNNARRRKKRGGGRRRFASRKRKGEKGGRGLAAYALRNPRKRKKGQGRDFNTDPPWAIVGEGEKEPGGVHGHVAQEITAKRKGGKGKEVNSFQGEAVLCAPPVGLSGNRGKGEKEDPCAVAFFPEENRRKGE